MSAQTAADLRQAAEVIQSDGWAQGAYHSDGKHCLAGAIAVAVGQHRPATSELLSGSHWWPIDNGWATCVLGSDPGRRRLKAESALERHLAEDLVSWNDNPGRTAADVIDLLLSTADMEDQK
jgi:hypothetical protein